jgi:hypothetical protein
LQQIFAEEGIKSETRISSADNRGAEVVAAETPAGFQSINLEAAKG